MSPSNDSGMQSITISNDLHIFLTTKAGRAHHGSINEFLCSHFSVRPQLEVNPDRKIRDLPNEQAFRQTYSLSERYKLFLQALLRINHSAFDRINNFRWPHLGDRIVLSKNPRALKTPKRLLESQYFYCLGFNDREYQDLVFHLLRDLRYPLPVCQELRRAFTKEQASTDFLDMIKDL